ncbi:MAG: response regulator [Bacteroidota bacterium]
MEEKLSFLIADDEQGILITREKLIQSTFPESIIHKAENGSSAWEIIKSQNPSVVICDLSMPEMDGLQVLIKTRSDKSLNNIYFIMLTASTDRQERIRALDKGADDFINKPVISDEFRARLRSAVRISEMQTQLADENKLLMELADELEKDIQDMIMLVVQFMQARIPASYECLKRIARASTWIAGQLDDTNDEDKLRDVEIAAYLSHSGRIFLPDHLLKRPVLIDGKPSDKLMHQVPVAARDIVSDVRRFRDIGNVLYHLYENIDGSGFPDRLKSWQIPLISRIIRVPLDFEEILNYSDKSPSEAINDIKRNSNQLYDHRVVVLMDQYLSIQYDDGPNIRAVLLSELKEGMILAKDIVTEKGMMLMPAGAVLKDPFIEKIISHNTSDTILGNIYIKK